MMMQSGGRNDRPGNRNDSAGDIDNGGRSVGGQSWRINPNAKLNPNVSKNNFRSSQSGYIDRDYVNELAKKYKDPEEAMWLEPIEVTRDGVIIDGHHRYAAMKQAGVEIDYVIVEPF